MASLNKQTNVVVFAGAGASRALPETHFPTTVEFFDSLPDQIKDDRYFSFVETFLRASKGGAVIDIEEVLLELQNLISFLRSANNPNSIIGRAVSSNLLASVQQGMSFGHLNGGGAQLASALESLQGRINAQVYRLYSKEPTEIELGQTWNPLLLGISSCSFDIFTTNYDLVIESALSSTADDATMYRYLGASGRTQKKLDLTQWQEDAKRSSGLLTKLHGSLNWKLDNGEILLGDWAFTGNHAKQAIIYPGFKGNSDAVFFGPFHEYLTRTLARADHVLVIGFAFRDEAINQIFQASLNPSAKITLMDLNDRLTVPVRRKVQRLKGFDTSTVVSFLSSIRESRKNAA